MLSHPARRAPLVAAACLFPFAAASAPAAAALYFDDFSGDAATNLHGTTPDATVGTNTWRASPEYKADGSVTAATLAKSAWLPLTLDTGSTYEVTTVFDLAAAASTNWVALGFSRQATPADSFAAGTNNGGNPWVLLRQNGNTSAWAGPSTLNQWANNQATGLTIGNDLSLRIVVTTGGDLATSTIAMYAASPDATYQLDLDAGSASLTRDVDLTGVQWVGIGTSNTTPTFESFSVTVPEPASVALVALGTLAALGRRK